MTAGRADTRIGQLLIRARFAVSFGDALDLDLVSGEQAPPATEAVVVPQDVHLILGDVATIEDTRETPEQVLAASAQERPRRPGSIVVAPPKQGAPLPAARTLDGYDLSGVLQGRGPSPRTTYFYYRGATLQAVRSGRFKLHFFTRPDGNHEPARPLDPPWLFDLDQDPGEQRDIAVERPDVVAELRRRADEHRRGVTPVEDQVAKR